MYFDALQSFIAGIQDVIEPTFTFVLAWALGTAMQVSITACMGTSKLFVLSMFCLHSPIGKLKFAFYLHIQDIHTNAYIAQALNSGGVRAEYLPPLITIIGYLMSFAAGSVSSLHT